MAYASLSPRTDLDVLGEFAQLLDYELVTFERIDAAAPPVYHTNVVMAIGARFAVVCGEAIALAPQRGARVQQAGAAGHRSSTSRRAADAGVRGQRAGAVGGRRCSIALSTTAWRSLDAAAAQALESYARPLFPPSIPTIERIGGGGVRCMLAEVHLPKPSRAKLHPVS